jgi:chromosome segregation ATPase
MSDLAAVKEFTERLAAAVDALERAAEADERAARAEQLERGANDRRTQHEEAMARTKADTDSHVAERCQALKEQVAVSEASLVEHRKKHDAIVATAKAQVDDVSLVRERINEEIAALRDERGRLNAEVAGLRAKVTDLAASL